MYLPKKWILIVEDEKDLKDLLEEELNSQGFGVHTSAKAADAMRLLRNQKFDCVLLDMMLEGGNGSQIIFSIRDDKKGLNRDTPVLVASGQLNTDMVIKIRNHISGVFVKPFDMNALLNKVKILCAEPGEEEKS